MQFLPVMHRILLKPQIETETESGLVVAWDKRKVAVDCEVAIVAHIGESAFKAFGFDEPPIKVGDTVYYSKYGAKVMDIDGELMIACNDEDIILKGDKNG